jgi:transcriptional pleiotropic regulator of transition state genes
MKNIGIVRDIDKLGRFVIPIELRNKLGIENGDSLEIFAEQDRIVLKKYEPCCVFCKGEQDVAIFMDKNVCKSCLDMLKSL